MHIAPNLLTVEARVLPAPRLEYQMPKSKPFQPKDGRWNISNHSFKLAKKLTTWAIMKVCVSPEGNTADPNFNNVTSAVIESFKKNLENSGLGKAKPTICQLELIGNRCLDQNSRNDVRIKEKIKSLMNKVQLVFVILSQKDQFIYNRIKYYTDVAAGLKCVCATAERFGANRQDTFANIAHKMNLKLGGINHALNDKLDTLIGDKTMIVGIDVTHPSPGSIENSPSIAGKSRCLKFEMRNNTDR